MKFWVDLKSLSHLILVFFCLFMFFMFGKESPVLLFAFCLIYIFSIFFVNWGRDFLFTGFYVIFYFFSIMISLLFVYNGIFMFEIMEYGRFNNAFLVLLIFFSCGLFFSKFGYELFNFKEIKEYNVIIRKNHLLLSRVASYLVIIFAVFILFVYGSPVLLGMERFEFWGSVVPEYLSFYPSLYSQFLIFVLYFICVNFKNGKNSFESYFLIVSYLLIAFFVLGQKFSMFIIIISVSMFVIFGIFGEVKFDVKKNISILFLFLFIIYAIYLNYSSYGRDLFFVIQRIALQAQLIWSVIEYDFSIFNFLSVDFSNYSDKRDFISHRYLHPDVYMRYSENNVVLSGFFPAIFILNYGLFFSVILYSIISIIIGVLQRMLIYSIHVGDLIISFLLLKIYFGIIFYCFAGIETALIGALKGGGLLVIYYLIMYVLKQGGFKSEVQHP